MAELRTLDAGVRRGEAFKGTVIPTIAEVFATIPDQKKIYIEIKCGGEIIPTLIEEIKKSGLKKEQIVVICFKKNVLQQMKAQAPQYKVSWLSGVGKDEPGKPNSSSDKILATLKQINADGFSSSTGNVSEPFIKRIKQAGYEYHVWTVDDPKVANRFSSWGTNSITTNVPGHIRKNLVQ